MSADKYLGEWRTTRWERGFAALRKFRAREGHCCPSRRHAEGGFRLGQWVSVQRYRKDLLSAKRGAISPAIVNRNGRHERAGH
jgi:Helicase associated domain